MNPGNPGKCGTHGNTSTRRETERETVVHDGAVLVVSCQTRHGLVRGLWSLYCACKLQKAGCIQLLVRRTALLAADVVVGGLCEVAMPTRVRVKWTEVK